MANRFNPKHPERGLSKKQIQILKELDAAGGTVRQRPYPEDRDKVNRRYMRDRFPDWYDSRSVGRLAERGLVDLMVLKHGTRRLRRSTRRPPAREIRLTSLGREALEA